MPESAGWSGSRWSARCWRGWPDGILAILAVKAFARYPELKSGQGTGAIERFIIGTFTSLGWAALCAGVVVVMLR